MTEKKMENKGKHKSLIRNTFIFALGNVGSKLVLFLLVPLYTNYLTTAEYGTADLVFTIGQIVIPFASCGIYAAVIRFGISKKYNRNDVLRNSFRIIGVGSVVTIILTPLLRFYSALSDWKWYMCAYVIVDLFASVEMNYLKAKEKNRSYAVISITRTLILAVSNIIFIVILKTGVPGYLMSTIIAALYAIILSFIVGGLSQDIKNSKFDKALMKEILIFSFPLILNGISWWIIHSSDKVMIELMISASALGVYTVAGKIPSVINVIVSVFSQAWDISSIKEIEGENDTLFFSSVFDKFSTLMFSISIIAVILSKPFMSFYVGISFDSAWLYVPLLLVSAAFGAIGTFFGSFFGPLNKNNLVMYSTIAGAVLNIVINYFAIPKLGIWGAVLGTVISYALIGLFRMFTALKYLKMHINWISFSFNCVIMTITACAIGFDIYPVAISGIAIVIYFAINFQSLRRMTLDLIGFLKKTKR